MPDTQPDAIAAALSQTASPLLFAAAGEALAQDLLDHGRVSPSHVRLLDSMDRVADEVRWAMVEQTHAPLRASVAAAAVVLGQARPSQSRRVRGWVAQIMATSSPVQWTPDHSTIALRAMLCLIGGDVAGAERAVRLLRQRGDAIGPVLVEWTAGQRARGTDPRRAWEGLRAWARRVEQPVPALLLVAAVFALPNAPVMSHVPSSTRRIEAPSMG
ncbi:MAG: hypothetical protein AB8H79_25885 [Myxococcota bacterium]